MFAVCHSGAGLCSGFSQQSQHGVLVSLLNCKAQVCGLPNASDIVEVLLELADSEGFQGTGKTLNIHTDIPGRTACGVCVFLKL